MAFFPRLSPRGATSAFGCWPGSRFSRALFPRGELVGRGIVRCFRRRRDEQWPRRRRTGPTANVRLGTAETKDCRGHFGEVALLGGAPPSRGLESACLERRTFVRRGGLRRGRRTDTGALPFYDFSQGSPQLCPNRLKTLAAPVKNGPGQKRPVQRMPTMPIFDCPFEGPVFWPGREGAFKAPPKAFCDGDA
ncbi:hypothetical protein M885DRAFT_531217 [Pelagophyceae sp. CCMP2097]|nr:hypothetical protein M885DRAFT_531217 [Pelagophyceae sp. CCMP2097]